jgi:DNA topoisomerase III
VERERAIRAFVPEDYREVVATFAPVVTRGAPPGKPGSALIPPVRQGEPAGVTYEGTYFREQAPEPAKRGREAPARGAAKERPERVRRLPADTDEADQIAARARTGRAAVESIDSETKRIPPPLLYDLTELQRHANRLYGMSAQRTLDTAQSLYERHKLISYPRTDSRHLSTDVATTLPQVVQAVAGRYPGLLAPRTGAQPLGRRFVDDAQVTDHHAILPTSKPAGALGADEEKIYDLICRRLLAAWHEDHVYSITTLITAIHNDASLGAGPTLDRYLSTGTAVERVGWKVLDIGGGKKAPSKRGAGKDKDKEETEGEPPLADQALPPGLVAGQPQRVKKAEVVNRRTRPPPRLTEGALLTAMETAGRTLDDKELSDAMKDLGLDAAQARVPAPQRQIARADREGDGSCRGGAPGGQDAGHDG